MFKGLLVALAMFLIFEGMLCESQQEGTHTYSKIERTIAK